LHLVGIFPCRNEEWILGLSLRAMLLWMDEVIILDHASIKPIVAEDFCDEPARVTVLRDDDPTWHEMAQRQRLLEAARAHRATHIAILDADEIVSGSLIPNRARSMAERTMPSTMVALPQIVCRGSIYQQHQSGIWAEQDTGICFKDQIAFHWKARNGYEHHHRAPYGMHQAGRCVVNREFGGLFHLQFVDDGRLRAKQFHYQLMERIRWPHKSVDEIRRQYSWSIYGATGPTEGHDLKPIPELWWEPYKQWLHYLKPESEPWYIPEIRRILRENPGIESGLDNFGVVV
jgi:hypothetical protein